MAGIPALQTRGKATPSVGGSNTGLPGNEHSVELPSTTSWCEPSNIPQSLRDAMDEAASCSLPRRKECQRVRQSHLPQNMAGTHTGVSSRQVCQRVLATPGGSGRQAAVTEWPQSHTHQPATPPYSTTLLSTFVRLAREKCCRVSQ